MKVMLINNEGEGFADFVDVESGTTLGTLLSNRLSDDRDSLLVRVNRNDEGDNYELKEGDRVTITPRNIEGA